MKKVRRIHFWIGIIASIFLFIESLTGIFMYFGGEDRAGHQGFRNFQTQNGANFQQNGQGSSNSSSTDNGSNNTNSPSSFNQNGQRSFASRANGQFNRGGFGPQGGTGSFSRIVRQLHSGIIGLIAGIGMLLLTGTGLVMAIMIVGTKRKQKKRSETAKVS